MMVKNDLDALKKVLVVCLGNICRSPAAQGILIENIDARGLNISVDSAGTAAYHIGKSPDKRSIAELKSRSIDICSQRARQVCLDDFERFDWILAMDKYNLSDLQSICPSSLKAKVRLFSSFNQDNPNKDVADPYYGEDDGFSLMADHLTLLSHHFLNFLETN